MTDSMRKRREAERNRDGRKEGQNQLCKKRKEEKWKRERNYHLKQCEEIEEETRTKEH